MASSKRKWAGLLVLSLALAIIILDTTVLNVSISAIIRDFNTTIQNIQWVITGYALTLAALTITGGRLGDLYGRKRMFIIGAIIFAIGSFICSISQNVPTMIAGEAIIEGVGAALMMPATSSLLLAMFQGRERAIAFGVWGAVAGSAAAIGPLIGGYLTTNYSWRWAFRINVFVVLLVLLGTFLIKESRDQEEQSGLDWWGVILSSVGLLSFVYGIIEASTYGWWFEKAPLVLNGHSYSLPWGLSITPFAIALGVLILVAFAKWEQRVVAKKKTPLINMAIFANNQFTSGAVTTAILSLGQAGLFFSLPVFFQSVTGLDAYHTGLAFLPMPLAVLVVAPLTAAFSHKVKAKFLIQAGLIINLVAYAVLRQELTITATSHSLIPGLLLFGIGFGLVMSQINNLTLSAVSVEEAGEASGINNTMRQIGSTLGSAIIGAVMLTALVSNLQTGVDQSTVIPSQIKPVISEAMTSQTSNVEFEGGAKIQGQLPEPVTKEVITIAHQATTDANRQALAYGLLFTAFALLASFWLPNVQDLERGTSAAAAH